MVVNEDGIARGTGETFLRKGKYEATKVDAACWYYAFRAIIEIYLSSLRRRSISILEATKRDTDRQPLDCGKRLFATAEVEPGERVRANSWTDSCQFGGLTPVGGPREVVAVDTASDT